jgi:hypothetical protein
MAPFTSDCFSTGLAIVFGLTQIRRAEAFLAGPEGYLPSREDLADAFNCVWLALRFADLWPEEVRDRAAGLIVAMLRHGPYHETARRMSGEEVREFVALVRKFVDDADRARGMPADVRQGVGEPGASALARRHVTLGVVAQPE